MRARSLGLDGDVQRGNGFVTDDHLRIECQRTRNTNTLTLATTKSMGIATHVFRAQPHDFQQFSNAVTLLIANHHFIVVQWLRYDLFERHAWIK